MNFIKPTELLSDNYKQYKNDSSIKKEWSLVVETHFDSAHRLCQYNGKCKKIHGHTYRVVVSITANNLLNWGAVEDFGDLKKILKNKIEEKYDHKLILQTEDILNSKLKTILPNNWIVWMDKNPTAENMAYDIYKELVISFSNRIKVDYVIVYETPTNSAIYKEVNE